MNQKPTEAPTAEVAKLQTQWFEKLTQLHNLKEQESRLKAEMAQVNQSLVKVGGGIFMDW